VFTIQLSLASLLGVCLVALIGAGWVFAFGVIIGRGFEPDKKLPLLGRLMAPAAETTPEAQTGIIKAEELTFLSDLKTQPTLSTEQSAPSSGTGENRPEDAKRPAGQTQAASASGPAAPGAKTQRYDFMFQVVAYKKSAQADAFREKLENVGLRTRLQVEKDTQGNPRIYRVQVLFKGTDADADQVLATLNRHGVKNPMLASRKPIQAAP
jgi:cell division protein FtsN